MKKKTLFALALAATPFLANASEANGIGYTYGQLDYTYQDADGPYFNGGTLSGSFAFNDYLFGTASYGKVSDSYNEWFSGAGVRASSEAWSLGLGVNTAIGSRADWVSQLAYVDKHNSAHWRHSACGNAGWDCDHSVNLRGGRISTGIMGRVTDQLTANAYLGYEDYNHGYEGNYFAEFGAVYAFDATWGLHAGLTLAEGDETYNLGIRASF